MVSESLFLGERFVSTDKDRVEELVTNSIRDFISSSGLRTPLPTESPDCEWTPKARFMALVC